VFEDLAIEEELVAQAGGTLLFDERARSPEEWLSQARDADAVVTCHAMLPGEFVRELRSCRAIARYGVGIDNVDLIAATESGIPVTHVPDYCVDEVSTHTMALLLALNRSVVTLDRATRSGRWQAADAGPVRRLKGQVLGLVGYGRNARAVAEKARAFGMSVLAYDPFLQDTDVNQPATRLVDLSELLETADYVSLHSPLTPQTQHLIDAGSLRRMKSSAYLINTARGGLVDTSALRLALDSGVIAGAAIDVLETEPPEFPFDCETAVVTPHTAFASVESIADLKRLTFQRVIAILDGLRPEVLANPEVWDRRRGL